MKVLVGAGGVIVAVLLLLPEEFLIAAPLLAYASDMGIKFDMTTLKYVGAILILVFLIVFLTPDEPAPRRKKRWGKIGAPKSATRRVWLRKIRAMR